jgi:lipopolysaccharide transport system ATP-binding protein
MSSDNPAASVEVGESAIRVGHVAKSYRMYRKPSERLLHAIFGGSEGGASEFWALKDVSLDVRRGETFGIIGRNGSGKSTLLQIIAGTLLPTRGDVAVQGRVAALLELGSGFNPDFTGRENVYLNATILGLTRREIDERLQSILAFAGIGEFIDQPVRSYSSGMSVRLAFAVIAHVDADVLIVDEALSVGDVFFAQKCMRFLREFKKSGTLLFVSHDAAAVTNLCDRALWLDSGVMQMQGSAKDVVEAYLAQQHATDRRDATGAEVHVSGVRGATETDAPDFRAAAQRELGHAGRMSIFEFDPDQAGMEFGSGMAKIVSVGLYDDAGSALSLTEGGEIVRLRIAARMEHHIDGLIFGFYVKDRLGQRLFGDNTYLSTSSPSISGMSGEVVEAEFRFRMPRMPMGSYLVDVAIASGTQDEHTQHHWLHDAIEIKALDLTMRYGLIGIPMLGISITKGGGQ